MTLQEDCANRSYVFGRILACADYLEYRAEKLRANKSDDRRPTNAQRLEVAFTQRPAKYCKELQKQLAPYIARLIKNGASTFPQNKMLELIASIPMEDFTNKPLDELYLLGYASQRQEFFSSKKSVATNDDNSIDEIQEEY